MDLCVCVCVCVGGMVKRELISEGHMPQCSTTEQDQKIILKGDENNILQ